MEDSTSAPRTVDWGACQGAIGPSTAKDHAIDPAGHAAGLPPSAGALRRVLERSAITAAARRYAAADADAVEAQRIYKGHGSRALWTATIGGALGAVVLYLTDAGSAHASTHWARLARKALLVAQVVTLAVAATYSYLLGQGEEFKRWMERRAAAEQARRQLFEAVVAEADPGPGAPGELPLLPLKLEYVRRYHLDVQRSYFRNRGAQHRRAARRQLLLGGGLVFVGSLGAGLGGMAGDLGDWVGALALTGVTTPLFLSMITNLSLLGQDRSNALRYESMRDVLDGWLGQIDRLRERVVAGEAAALAEYLARVNADLAAELDVWLKGREPSFEPPRARKDI